MRDPRAVIDKRGNPFPAAQLTLQGPTAECKLISEAQNEVSRVFCPACGGPILGRNTAMAGWVTLSLGTMDDSNGLRPDVVVFARNRKSWDQVDESIPSLERQPAWSPGDA